MNPITETILVLIYAVIFILIIQRARFFETPGLSRKTIMGVFGIKILAGVFLALIYTHYYSNRLEADVFKYFDDSKIMYDALWQNPEDFFRMLFGAYGGNDYYFMHEYYYEMNNWYTEFEGETFNDTHTIIRFNALLRVFSLGVYHVHTVVVCFLSLCGMIAMYKVFVPFYEKKERLLFMALFLFPSIVFWGSGVLKEGLLLFGLGGLIYSVFEMIHGRIKWYFILLFVFSFFILIFLKIYALLLMLPFLLAYFLVKKYQLKNSWLVYISCFVLALLVAVNFHHIKPDFRILEIITAKQHDFIHHAENLDSKSRLDISQLEPNLLSFAQHAPQAFYISFFRPYFFESSNPFMILAGLENLALLILLVFCLYKRDQLRYEQKNLLYFLLFYSVLMFVLVGMVTPVMGAMVRYKVPALGILASAFILIGNWQSLFNNYPKLKKLLKLE